MTGVVTVSLARRVLRAAAVSAAVLALYGLGGGCGEDGTPSGPKPPDNHGPDTIPPAAVSDLRLRSPTSDSFALAWTSPGDDGASGTASSYDVRFSKTTIDSAAWDAAVRVDPAVVPNPQTAGHIERLVVLGLESNTRYYFALKTSDEKGNESGLSNCASAMTLDEAIPPATVQDFAADPVDDATVRFTWTAPGDDWMAGKASGYAIRFSRDPIESEEAWQAATEAGVIPAEKPAGETETAALSRSEFGSNLFYALKAVDDSGNWSAVSNWAAGMGFSKKIWAYPDTVYAGGVTTIRFRSDATGGSLQVSVHSDLGWYTCTDHLIEVLAAGEFPVGVFSVTYDFMTPSAGYYLPAGEYLILLCRNQELVRGAIVDFVH